MDPKINDDEDTIIDTLKRDIKAALRHHQETVQESDLPKTLLRAWDRFLISIGVTKDTK